jgi:hypothetical protein
MKARTDGGCQYCKWCLWHIPFPETPDIRDDEGWKRVAIYHRASCSWVYAKGNIAEPEDLESEAELPEAPDSTGPSQAPTQEGFLL